MKRNELVSCRMHLSKVSMRHCKKESPKQIMKRTKERGENADKNSGPLSMREWGTPLRTAKFFFS